MVVFLDNEQSSPGSGTRPPRQARVQVFIEKLLHEIIVNLDQQAVASNKELHGRHSYIDTDFMKQVGDACLADEQVQREIESLKLSEGATVVVEPWAYATDGVKNMKERWTMVGSIPLFHSCNDIC